MSDPLTSSCSQTLSTWTAPEAEQEHLRTVFLNHLEACRGRSAPGWSRDCAGAHLTASALICTRDAALLTLHAKLDRWLQTGGHIELDDPSLPEAALREAQEESGLAGLWLDPVPVLLSRHEVPCGPISPCFHLDVQFLARADVAAAPVVGAESHDVAWFGFDGLPEVDDSVRALVDAARSRLAGPGAD